MSNIEYWRGHKIRPATELAGTSIEASHATSSEAARAIKAENRMYPGQRGAFGAAMYFATAILPAFDKVQTHGTGYVQVRLSLHNPVELYEPWNDLTYDILQERGFDSVVANFFRTETDYAMYRSQDVEVLKVDENFPIAEYHASIQRAVLADQLVAHFSLINMICRGGRR
jgi:hypothetical protein